MIISDTHRFVFIHNPKCAGTSVRKVLSEYDTSYGRFWRRTDTRLPRIDMAHMEIGYIKKYYPTVWAKLGSYFVFGFVRDPIARLLSGFNETHKDIYKITLLGDKHAIDVYKSTFRKYCIRILSSNPDSHPFTHTVPQYLMFYLDNKCLADLIIKVETISSASLQRLNPFLPEICTILCKSLLSGKKSNEKPFPFTVEDIVGPQMLDDLREYYLKDLQLFEYTTTPLG